MTGVAVVIGNSSGIGHALTSSLLETGWQVLGISRSASPLEHERYRHEIADVGAPDYRAVLNRQLPAQIDVCVYCAGIGEPFALVGVTADVPTFATNLLGAAATVEVVVPRMLAAGGGHFIGLSSLAAEAPSADAPSYAASKAGLSAYLVGLALALRSRGVHVTDVRFGFVDTKMAKAPTRPLMISPERAARVIIRSFARRPIQVSYPWRIAILMHVVRWLQAARVIRTAFVRAPGPQR